ncbi:MAG: HlyD family secretion protein, partial [Pirellulales bacterium]|nr:HlyD family secretion protein [Pirellulales bacterium]
RLRELEERRATLLKQQELYTEQLKDLEVRSPIDGEVITWSVQELLLHRPVQRGQMLMQVANPKGEWQLELRMPEKRMGHIDRYRRALKEADPSGDLQVEFVLATDPDKTYEGTVVEINDRAEVRSEEGNTVLIKVRFGPDQKLPENLRPGAEASAKIMCGYRPVGYVLLCDAIAYVQRNILFRF